MTRHDDPGLDGPPPDVAETAWQQVYDALRSVASNHLSRERPGHSLRPSDLVHEAYLRLTHLDPAGFSDRLEFVKVASYVMRQVLVDFARRARTLKRGGAWDRVTLSGQALADDHDGLDAVVLDELLTALARLDERAARLVELRCFGGLKLVEAGEVLGLTDHQARKEWSFAKSWLMRALDGRD